MKRFLSLISAGLLMCMLLCACDKVPTGTESNTDGSTANTENADNSTEKKTEKTTDEKSTEAGADGEQTSYKVRNYDDMKAMWLSQFDLQNLYTQNGAQRGKAEYTVLIKRVLDNVKANGFNTVFIQLRPNADSIYPSEYYPPSVYAVGAYGKSFTYDPIEIAVELARERELSVHGWINPMRGMTDAQIKSVPATYKVKQWYNDSTKKGKYLVQNKNNWYLNPAYDEVRQLIIEGAGEAMEKYSLDGMHMDDYFYPTTDASFDSAAYSAYKADGGNKSLADWRRNNLNLLVKGLYDVTKSVNSDALYGISPAGNWNTVYDSHYADMKTWCAVKGYIDYICPQVYFGLEHQNYDFVKTSKQWQSYIKTDSVKLVIGVTFGKALSGVDNYAGTGKNEWTEHKDVMKRCLESTKGLEKCTGMSVFCYQYFYDPVSGAEVAATKQERDGFVALLKTISWN